MPHHTCQLSEALHRYRTLRIRTASVDPTTIMSRRPLRKRMLFSFRLGSGDLYNETGLPRLGIIAQHVASQVRDLAKVCLSVIVNGGVFGALCRHVGVWSVGV
jgi:hypothetical protein